MRRALLILACAASQGPAWASQTAPMPSSPEKSDLDEVDDLAEDDDFLPRSEGEDQKTRVDRITKAQAQELKLSHDEIRDKHDYVAAVALGSSKPWQAYDVEVGYVLQPNRVATLFAGGGPQKFEGVIEEKSYDLSVEARTVGLTYRYFFHRIEGMSAEALVGYATWDGKVSPHGSDDLIEDASDKLSSSFHASGVFGGVSTAISWLWENGVYIEWTLVGASGAKVTQVEYTRDSEVVDKAVKRDLQRGSFYGINNIKVGMHF